MFRFCSFQLFIPISTFKCVVIFLLEIKSIVSVKDKSLLGFLDKGTFQGGGGGVKFSKILRGVANKWGGLTDLGFFLVGGDLGKKG